MNNIRPLTKGGNMVKNKKKYHTYKSFMDAKDFKHNKLTIWFDKKVEKKLLNKLY